MYDEQEALKGSVKREMFEDSGMRKEMVVKMGEGETGAGVGRSV